MMKLRLIEQACGCSMVRGGGGHKLGARLCMWALVTRRMLLPPGQLTCRCSALQRSRRHDEAPTDRASLRLLHGARQRRTQGAVRVSAGGGRRYLHLLLFSETMFWVSLLDTAPSQHTAVAYPSDSRCVLISGTGWRRTQRACSSLPLAFVWRVLVAAIRHLTPAGVCLSGRSD